MAQNKFEYQLNNTVTGQPFFWLDCIKPNIEMLKFLEKDKNISRRILQNSASPEHLPTFEKDGDFYVLFLRIIEPDKKSKTDSVQELTTKITFLFNEHRLITLHRLDPDVIKKGRERLQKNEFSNPMALLIFLLTKSFDTYSEALLQIEDLTLEFENKVFRMQEDQTLIQEGHYLKRKVSAYKKVLKISHDAVEEFFLALLKKDSKFVMEKEFVEEAKIIQEKVKKLIFYSDEILETLTGLVNLNISLESQKTNMASYKSNEVMQALTVFSLFFLPLNFIVGLYGMNFSWMPYLNHPYGFWISVILMMSVSFFIFLWLKRKKLLMGL